jgi:hypothetical protein
MKVRRSLIATLVGIAMMIAMPIAVATGAVILIGHHDRWQSQDSYDSDLVFDEDGNDCYTATWPGEDDNYFGPSAGDEDLYYALSYHE